MPIDKKSGKNMDDEVLTNKDLEYIIDVNKKAIEINIEVEKQNEQVIAKLDEVAEKIDDMIKFQAEIKSEQKEIKRGIDDNLKLSEESKDVADEIKKISEETNTSVKDAIEGKIEDIEKNLFRLVIILGSAGIGTLITIIQSFFKK